ncbi:cellulose binding domain-containing protein [Actinoplanes sp. NBC_00393]|uniref:cellulose binding domain-containing protein n=1 Tax=Actinoplanes sp. NBC_00393 TaxID=2975953 RepID=UPI002E1AB0C0
MLPWLPTVIGVTALVGMLGVTAFRLAPPSQEPVIAQTAPTLFLPPPAPVPASLSLPSTSPTASPLPSAAGSLMPSAPPATQTSDARPSPADRKTTPPAAAPRPTSPPAVTGEYRVVGTYDAEFIGEVLISNATGRPLDWAVTLRFPSNVGDLRTSWVESAPQATLSQSGQTFTWRSGVPVNAGSSVALRFQFARAGSGDRPSACSVNGTPCDL